MTVIKCPICSSNRYKTPGMNYTRYCDKGHKYKVCPFCDFVFDHKFFDCPKCGAWLPNLPTSWARSATSLFLLRRVTENIYRNLNNTSDDSALARILSSMGIISVNPERINELGDRYWRGTIRRRASEYSTNLKYLGLLEKVEEGDKLTPLGEKFVESETKLDFDSIAILILISFWLTNKYDSRKTYAIHNIRPIFLSLKIINSLESNGLQASADHIGLAFMCRNETDDFKKALKLSEKFSPEYIHNLFFSKGREFNRAIIGVFSNWMEQAGLIEREKSSAGIRKISITEVGKEILKEIDDQKWSVYEPDFGKKLDLIKKIISETSKDGDLLSAIVPVGARIGMEWEERVLELLKKVGYGAEKYSEKRIFAEVVLPDEALNSLRGGTLHNPDIIIMDPLLLVDAKKDANSEMHKVQAYDLYALHPEVNGNALIVSEAMMLSRLADRILRLKKTSVIDKYALETIAANVKILKLERISRLFGVGNEEGRYINEDLVFECLKNARL